MAKSSNTLKLNTLKALLENNQFYFFFLIFWHSKFHSLLDAVGINSSLIFFKCFAFFKFNVLTQKFDKNISIGKIFIKIITNINIIKIFIKNTHLITRKYYINRIFIIIEHIFICIQSSVKFFTHFTCNKLIGDKLQWC